MDHNDNNDLLLMEHNPEEFPKDPKFPVDPHGYQIPRGPLMLPNLDAALDATILATNREQQNGSHHESIYGFVHGDGNGDGVFKTHIFLKVLLMDPGLGY